MIFICFFKCFCMQQGGKYSYLKRWYHNFSEERIWLWRNALKAQGLEAEAWARPKGETESRAVWSKI